MYIFAPTFNKSIKKNQSMKKLFTMIAVMALLASCCGNQSTKAKDAETRATTECKGECKGECKEESECKGECCKEKEAACCAGEGASDTETAVEKTPAAEATE